MAVAETTSSPTQLHLFGSDGAFSSAGIIFIKVFIALIVVAVLIVFAKIIGRIVSNKIRTKTIGGDEYTEQVTGLVSNVIFYLFVLIAILIGVQIIGFDGGIIIRGISFGIGFAFMDMFGNMAAGLFILTNKEFKLNNIIEIKEEGRVYFGRIEDITIRYTVIRLLNRRKVIIPNLHLITNPIMTFDSDDTVKLSFEMKIDSNTPIPRGLTIIKDAVNSVSFVKNTENTLVNIKDMKDNYLILLVDFYYDPQSGMLRKKAIGQIQEAILKACHEHSIRIPYEHKVITMDHNDSKFIDTVMQFIPR